jgi:hypothetical protein
MSRTIGERQQRGPSYRRAAAAVQSDQQSGQRPVSRDSAGIGPEGIGGHAAAGGEKAETQTRRLPLLLKQHAYDALKREGATGVGNSRHNGGVHEMKNRIWGWWELEPVTCSKALTFQFHRPFNPVLAQY